MSEAVQAIVNSEEVVAPVEERRYNGVYKKGKKWYSLVHLNKDENGKRKQKYVGSFITPEEAAVARNEYIEQNGLTCPKTKL